MLPPAPPQHKDDLRKKALSSILASSPQASNPLVLHQKRDEEEEVVQDEEEEEEEGDMFPAESDLNFPQRQSKLLVPKLASWEQYWDHRLDLWLPERMHSLNQNERMVPDLVPIINEVCKPTCDTKSQSLRKGRFSVHTPGSSGRVVLYIVSQFGPVFHQLHRKGRFSVYMACNSGRVVCSRAFGAPQCGTVFHQPRRKGHFSVYMAGNLGRVVCSTTFSALQCGPVFHQPCRKGHFNVYMAGNSGPVVLCCHGGGYTGLSWSLVACQLKDKSELVAEDMKISRGGYLRPETGVFLRAPCMCVPQLAVFNLTLFKTVALGFESRQLGHACLMSRGINPSVWQSPIHGAKAPRFAGFLVNFTPSALAHPVCPPPRNLASTPSKPCKASLQHQGVRRGCCLRR
eukprot:1143426-Pelagomonas_calceolata.AAC.10